MSNAKTFGTYEQCRFKDGIVQIEMLYENINFLIIFSLLSVILSLFYCIPHFLLAALSPLSLSISASLIIHHNDLSTHLLASTSHQQLASSSPPPLTKQLASPPTPTPLTSADAPRQAACFAFASVAPSNLPPSKSALSH